MPTFPRVSQRRPKTWREKLAALVVGLVVAWIVWLFVVWYAANYRPGPSRFSESAAPNAP